MNPLAALPLGRAEGQLSLPHSGMPEISRVSLADPAVSVRSARSFADIESALLR